MKMLLFWAVYCGFMGWMGSWLEKERPIKMHNSIVIDAPAPEERILP